MFKLVVIISLIVSSVTSAPINKKREIIVDRNGYYLGSGSNNNIREASQLYDITGPLANPWINPYTHVLNRPSAISPVTGGFPGGVAPSVAPAPPAPVFQQQQPVFQQQQQPVFQQQQQSYNYQYQQPAPQPQPQPQAPVQQQVYYQQQQQPAVAPQPQPQPQAPVQQYYYQQPQPQPQPAVAPQPQPQQSYYYQQQQPQPAPQPQPEPVPQQQQQQQSYSYGAQDQQSVPQFQDQSQFSSQMSQIPQLMSPSKDGKLQSFTAVFRPGQPVELKMGLPSDFQSGQYVKFNVN